LIDMLWLFIYLTSRCGVLGGGNSEQVMD